MNRTIRGTAVLANWPHAGDHWTLWKPVAYGFGGIALVLFGDVLIPAILHLLLLGLEVIEALFDHAVETIFHVDPWTSQLITAWTGFFVFLVIAYWTIRWLRRKIAEYKSMLSSWCHTHCFHA